MDHPSGIDRGTLTRQVGADVDRVAPLLARILLIRAIGGIGRGGSNGLWVARDVISSCGQLATAGATTRELARALAPSHDVDRDLTTAVAAVDELDWARKREDTEYAEYAKHTDPDTYQDRGRIEEAATAWEKERRHVRAAVGRVPRDLGNGEIGSVLLDRAIDRVFRRGLYYEIRYYHLAREPERAWQHRVAGVLLDAARTAVKHGRGTAGESLADDLRTSRRSLVDATPSTWAQQVATRLEENAVPVLTGQEPLTADRVTAIRLAALCLAHEPEARRDTALRDTFCTIVVGITQLAS